MNPSNDTVSSFAAIRARCLSVLTSDTVILTLCTRILAAMVCIGLLRFWGFV